MSSSAAVVKGRERERCSGCVYVCVEASHVQLLTTFLSLSCLYLYPIYSSFIVSFPKETKLACCSSRFSSARWERKVECCQCGEKRGEGGRAAREVGARTH